MKKRILKFIFCLGCLTNAVFLASCSPAGASENGAEASQKTLANWEERFAKKHVLGRLVITVSPKASDEIVKGKASMEGLLANVDFESVECLTSSLRDGGGGSGESVNLSYLVIFQRKDDESLLAAAKKIESMDFCQSIDLDYLNATATIPNDTRFNEQWALNSANDIDAQEA